LALIEFLLKNWIFVIIALTLFAQFRKASSRRGADKSPRGGKGSMPTFGGNPGIPGGSTAKPIQMPVAEKRQTSGSGFNSAIPYLEGRDRVSNRFPKENAASSETEHLHQDAYTESAAAGTFPTSANKLAQGIIWAEILGPPRAKKPYRRR
jgi:hypothetical protein